jgi:glycosyltransferase involved in cell wall biosynthesis
MLIIVVVFACTKRKLHMFTLDDGDLVIVPAWNEEASLPLALASLTKYIPRTQILVIDDGSTDGTLTVAKNFNVGVIHLPVNLGVGAAIRAGYMYAHLNKFQRVIHFDADLQHKVEEIPNLLESLNDSDIVIGSRFAGVSDYRMSLIRRMASKSLCLVISRRIKYPLTDVTSGFRASKGEAINLFARSYPTAYLADTVESLVLAYDQGLKVSEVFTPMDERIAGSPSHNAFKSFLHLLRAILVIISTMRLPFARTQKQLSS